MENFIKQLASESPVPGGGAAGCVFGAIGSAAAQMVLNLTKGKKKYAQFEEANSDALQELECLSNEFLYLKGIDEQAFGLVSKVCSLPKGEERDKELQNALQTAIQPPYSALEISLRGLEVLQGLVNTTNVNLISDLAVACAGLESAAKSCYYNVMINIKYIKDGEFCSFWSGKAKGCYDEALAKVALIEKEILQKIC